MKVLVIGSGGREHALVEKISQSKRVKKIFCAPGNGGTVEKATNVPIKPEDIRSLAAFAGDEGVDLTVVGPEAPLVAGIVDRFKKEGLRVFGPDSRAAQLEGSKVFAKELMRQHNIPTADFRVFDQPRAAHEFIDTCEKPVAVKADGLAAGKGVYVCREPEEAHRAVKEIMEDRLFGEAGARVVIEDLLEGEEASILALTDGRNIYPLESAQDHKPVFDGDQGPNTGGMGAYSPAPVVDGDTLDRIEREILVPVVHALRMEGIEYRGVIYAGLMITRTGPKVLEFNVRFGDPETQPLMTRLKSDLVEAMEAVIDGRLDRVQLVWRTQPAVCVVLASGGYPGSYEKGKLITGLEEAKKVPGVTIHHAGTERRPDGIYTSGGRVLGVTALGGDIAQARERAYQAVQLIHFEGMHYRRDIASRALAREKR